MIHPLTHSHLPLIFPLLLPLLSIHPIHRLVEKVPSYEAHLKAYIEAEDPENGIDDEYHPKVGTTTNSKPTLTIIPH